MRFRTYTRNLIPVLVLFLILSLVPFKTALGVDLQVKAESAILMEAHSGKILYEKEPHKKLFPASVTKLMTLVVAMDAVGQGKVKMTDLVTTSAEAASYGGSQIFLAEGEKLSFKDLMLGIALASGNDASVAVAEYVAGSQEAFVELMNKKATELGCKNTHFVNCNGLHDPNHYTTAYDLALIAQNALQYPELREMSSLKHYRIRTESNKPFQYDNKNKLLWQYAGTDGFKTGWTNDAKYCFAGTVERAGLRFVSVVLGSPEKSGHFADTKILYNWGFSQYTFKEFYKDNEVISQVQVGKGEKDQVEAIAVRRVGVTLPKGEDKNLSTAVELFPLANAPLEKGQVVGQISVIKDGQILDRTDLVAKENVAKGSLWREFQKVIKAVVING